MGKPTNDPSNYIALGVQSAKDVAPTTFFFFKHLEGSGFELDSEVQSEREGGDGQEVGLRYISKLTSDGALNNRARPGVVGRLWAWTLGQEPTVGSLAVGLQEHIAAPAASLPWLGADQRAPEDVVERCLNNVMTSLTEEWEAGRPLSISAQFISAGSVSRRPSASTLVVTRETLAPFQYPGASVSLTVADGAGGNATAVAITKGKIELKRGVDDDIQTTGLNREDAIPLAFDVDFEGTLRYESLDIYRNVYYGAGSVAITELATGTFNLFTQRGSFTHRVNIPIMDITSAKISRLDPDGKTVYMDVAGMTKKGATHSIFAVTRTPDASSYLVA